MADRSSQLSPQRRRAAPAWVLALAAVLLGACATDAPRPPPSAMPAAEPTAVRDDVGLHLELVERLLDDGRAYAALAHLDALDPEAAARPEARLLRGETLRHMDRASEARHIYESLAGSELSAYALRGLALLAAREGDVETAVGGLERARRLRPTDARIRNDLGYALLLTGALEAARTELTTAVQLGDEHRAPRNLVLLHFVRDEAEGAQQLASRYRIETPAVDRLERRAAALRTHLERGD